jgi:hypothetical protein
MRFIFNYNVSHIVEARQHADDIGVIFEVIQGSGNPLTPNDAFTNQYFVDQIATAMQHDSPEARGRICELMFGQISVDCNGDVYTCCAMPTHDSLRIGSYLDVTADDILLRRWTHPFCRVCTAQRRDATTSDMERVYQAVSSQIRLSARNFG